MAKISSSLTLIEQQELTKRNQTYYSRTYITDTAGLASLGRFSIDSPISAVISGFNITEFIHNVVIFPFDINIPSNSGTELTIGKINSGIMCKPIYDYLYTFYLGQYEYVASDFSDHNSYTEIQLYLPFLGYVNIDPDSILEYPETRAKVVFSLTLDYTTGIGTYKIYRSLYTIDFDSDEYTSNLFPTAGVRTFTEIGRMFLDRLIATYDCQIGNVIPIGQTNMAEVQRNRILGFANMAVNVGMAYYGVSTPKNTKVTTTNTTTSKTQRNPETGRQIKTSGTNTKQLSTTKTYSSDNIVGTSIQSLVGIESNAFVHANHSGSLSPNNNLNDGRSIIVIIRKPRYLYDRKDDYAYKRLIGIPSGVITQLQNVKGYVKCSDVYNLSFEGILSDELDELKSILLTGFYNET